VEFNVPSKLMTLMARGLPILAIVPPESEVARIVETSGGGWIADSALPDNAARLVAEIVGDRGELERRAGAARAFAERHFSIEHVAAQFEAVLEDVVVQDSEIRPK
jgi:colanic acid biosynthesis glycosyl transferase WcaI